MKLEVLRLQLVGAAWFAAAAGVFFPVSVAVFPGPGSIQMGQLLPAIYAGFSMYGVPAALAGALLTRWIVSGTAFFAFALGAIATLLTSILAGLWLTLLGGRFITWLAFFSNAVTSALGQVVVDVLLLRGLPFFLGGLAALGLRAVVINYGSVLKVER